MGKCTCFRTISSTQLAQLLRSACTHLVTSIHKTPLPCFAVRLDHRMTASQAIGNHTFAGFPPRVDGASVGQHFGLATLVSTHSLCKLAFRVIDPFVLNTKLFCNTGICWGTVCEHDGFGSLLLFSYVQVKRTVIYFLFALRWRFAIPGSSSDANVPQQQFPHVLKSDVIRNAKESGELGNVWEGKWT